MPTNRLAVAAAHVRSRLAASAAVTVTYRREAYSASFTATVGSSLLKVQDAGSGDCSQKCSCRNLKKTEGRAALNGQNVETKGQTSWGINPRSNVPKAAAKELQKQLVFNYLRCKDLLLPC